MLNKLLFSTCFFLAAHTAFSQGVAINEDNSSADASAILDVKSTTKGMLAPRMTAAQRSAITSPANGLLVYQTDGATGFYYYNGAIWVAVQLIPTGGTAGQVLSKIDATNYNTQWVTPSTGGLTGSGTATFLPKFTTATALGNSLLQDNGTSIAINTAPTTIYPFYVYKQQLTVSGDGQATIRGYRTRDSQNDGTAYSQIATNSAVSGYNFWGDVYTFGVAGHSYNDYTRTGGVLGAEQGGAYWGSLGYRNSGLINYGVYGSAAYASGAGRLMSNELTGIGAGFYGGVMGGWVRGEVLGFTSAGEVYASYNVGNEYTSGHQVDIVTNGNNERTAAFATTSTSLKVNDDGFAQLQNGQATIAFSQEFLALMAQGERPVVTVTAIGSPVSLYIRSIDKGGFSVASTDGSSTTNVEFSWTAVVKRVDANTAQVPNMLLDKNFDEKLKGTMFNEGNLEQSAQPMWWDGTQLRFDAPPKQKIDKKEEN